MQLLMNFRNAQFCYLADFDVAIWFLAESLLLLENWKLVYCVLEEITNLLNFTQPVFYFGHVGLIYGSTDTYCYQQIYKYQNT